MIRGGLVCSNMIFTLFFIAILPLAFILSTVLFRFIQRVYPIVREECNFINKLEQWPTVVDHVPGRVERSLRWAGYRRPIPRAVSLIIIVGFIIFVLAAIGGWYGVMVALGAGLFVFGYVITKARQARLRAVVQLPDMLQSLVDSLRAGYSLPQAIIFVAEEFPTPLREVLGALVRAEALRLDFVAALVRVSRQIALPEWQLIVEVLETQRTVGGNIIPLIEEIGKTIRQRVALAQEVKTSTAAGRMSGWIIAGLVPFLLIFFFFVSPAYVAPLLASTLGRWLLALAAVLEVVGFIWIYRLVKIEY